MQSAQENRLEISHVGAWWRYGLGASVQSAVNRDDVSTCNWKL